MTLRRQLSPEDQELVEKHEQQQQTAEKLRAQVARFRETFALSALQGKLPLPFPTLVCVAEPFHFRALSWYTYPGWAALEGKQLKVLSALYVALHLVDFSPLRAELIARTDIRLNWPGQTPFDPVSLFLCCLLRLEKGLGWKELAKFLAGPEGGCWQQLFGFRDERIPAASTMRAFFNSLGQAFNTDLGPRFIELLRSAALLPAYSTHPTTPPQRGLPLACDGMLHQAHSSMRCGQVTDRCYEPSSAENPRPCPAKEKGYQGCDCSEPACAERCRLTTPRDSQARLIHYSGSNQNEEQDSDRGHDVYGYRSYAQVLCDDELHVSWVAYSSAYSANTDERVIFPLDFSRLRQRLPRLTIGEVIADSAIGYGECLRRIYRAKAIAVVTIRRDKRDRDEAHCRWRGYSKNGHLLCAHGYRMSFNGLDYKRLRAGWVCQQACREAENPQPEDETCPFRDPERPLGQVRHVSEALLHTDGSRHERLARLYPYGSALWKTHYSSRHNAIEGRNSQLTRLGLKRVWSYELDGATADITFADLLINLRTLGRLVQQATLLVDSGQAKPA